jgi:hypothetical protein
MTPNENKFVVIRELKTKTISGNIVTEDFSISEIIDSIGEKVIDAEHEIHYNNEKVFLIISCRKKSIRKADKSPLDYIK